MSHIVHADADSAFKLIFYFIVFVLWIAAQLASAAKKKKQREELERTSAHPKEPRQEQPAASSLDSDLGRLLEQLTGQPMIPSQPVPRPPPPPAPQRAATPLQAQRRPAQRADVRSATVRKMPPPVPAQMAQRPSPVAPEEWKFSAPATASAVAVSVHAKELSVNLPKMRMPIFRLPSVNLQRATERPTRTSWIKAPQSLRQNMIGRMILDPPKALDFSHH